MEVWEEGKLNVMETMVGPGQATTEKMTYKDKKKSFIKKQS
jgi:hypothetical protein